VIKLPLLSQQLDAIGQMAMQRYRELCESFPSMPDSLALRIRREAVEPYMAALDAIAGDIEADSDVRRQA